MERLIDKLAVIGEIMNKISNSLKYMEKEALYGIFCWLFLRRFS